VIFTARTLPYFWRVPRGVYLVDVVVVGSYSMDSSFDNAVFGFGGSNGGGFSGADGGGYGGRGGTRLDEQFDTGLRTFFGGGGGAGGYIGNGGSGGNGGDHVLYGDLIYYGGYGGGVGLYGLGESGAGGAGLSAGASGSGGGGGGGSGGARTIQDGAPGSNGLKLLYGGGDRAGGNGGGLGWKNKIPVNPGQIIKIMAGAGNGAVRVMWGVNRSFPNNAA
jgi:hypothetical protein